MGLIYRVSRPVEASDEYIPIETLDVDALEPLVGGGDESAHALGPELGGVVSVRPHLAGRACRILDRDRSRHPLIKV